MAILAAINNAGNANGDMNNVNGIIDYERLGAVLQSKKVFVVSSEITDQQAVDTKIQDSVQF